MIVRHTTVSHCRVPWFALYGVAGGQDGRCRPEYTQVCSAGWEWWNTVGKISNWLKSTRAEVWGKQLGERAGGCEDVLRLATASISALCGGEAALNEWGNECSARQIIEQIIEQKVSRYLSSDCTWSENGGRCAWGGGGAGLGPQVRSEEDQEASHHQVGRNLPPFSSTSGKADVLYNVYRYLLGSEQMSDQIMRWRGCWAKPGAPIVIFSGAGWLVLNIATISCFGDTFHLFSSGTSLWLFLACLQILHSAEFALFGKPWKFSSKPRQSLTLAAIAGLCSSQGWEEAWLLPSLGSRVSLLSAISRWIIEYKKVGTLAVNRWGAWVTQWKWRGWLRKNCKKCTLCRAWLSGERVASFSISWLSQAERSERLWQAGSTIPAGGTDRGPGACGGLCQAGWAGLTFF